MSSRQKRYPKYEAVGKALHEKYESLIRDIRPKITYQVIKDEGGPAPRITSRLLNGYEQLGQPSARKNILSIIAALVKRKAIKTKDVADEILQIAGFDTLSEDRKEDREVLEFFDKSLDRPRYLTVTQTELIGRHNDIANIFRLLLEDGIQFLTLTGPPGVGKTELARQIQKIAIRQEHFSEVCFTSLAGKTSVTHVMDDIRDLLPPDTQTKALFILDACEEIEDTIGVTREIYGLLLKYPKVYVLATSQAPFNKREYRVPALDKPLAANEPLDKLQTYDAVELFRQHAKRNGDSEKYPLTEQNAKTIATLCRALDGLPLAILVAASCAKYRTIDDVLNWYITNELFERRYKPDDNNRRHKTLNSLYEFSYSLLTAQEQTLFRRLGVFYDKCRLEAVKAICNFDDLLSDLEDILENLNDRSLIIYQNSTIDIHHTLRLFAARQIPTEEEVMELSLSYTDYYYELLLEYKMAEATLSDKERDDLEAFLSVEYNNVVWALDQAKILRFTYLMGRTQVTTMNINNEKIELFTVWKILENHEFTEKGYWRDDGRKLLHITDEKEFTEEELKTIFFVNEFYKAIKTEIPYPLFMELLHFVVNNKVNKRSA